jgi:hypothetical protein
MKSQWHGRMRHLGALRGTGTLGCSGVVLGTADYEIDGFCTKPGEVVGSGEISMAPAELDSAFGRHGLELTTAEGRVLQVRFSGGRRDRRGGVAHADILGGLPAEDEWPR